MPWLTSIEMSRVHGNLANARQPGTRHFTQRNGIFDEGYKVKRHRHAEQDEDLIRLIRDAIEIELLVVGDLTVGLRGTWDQDMCLMRQQSLQSVGRGFWMLDLRNNDWV